MMMAMNDASFPPSACRFPRVSRGEWIVLVLLIAVLFGLYRHTLRYGLEWDTKDFARESVLLNRERPLADAFRYGMIHGQLGDYGGSFYYRPLWNLSLMLEQRLWGFHARGIRLVNLALFSLALALLFLFLKLQGGHEDLALLATALFAFLPFQADNVVWGVARCDLFLLLWGLLALIGFHMRLAGRGRSWAALAAASFALGMLSKETFALFIPFLAAYEWAWRRRLDWRRYPAFILTAAAFFILKHGVLHLASLPMRPLPSPAASAGLFFSTAGYYARILLVPFGYPKFAFPEEIAGAGFLLLGIAFLAALGFLLLRGRPRRALAPAALVLIFLLPHVGLAFSPLWPFRIAARYMLLPAVGAAWLLALALGRVKRGLRIAATAALVAACLPFLLRSGFAYRDEVAYWAEAGRAHPRNATMRLFLAKAQYNAGQVLLARHTLIQGQRLPADRLTAGYMVDLRAGLEFQRCDYDAALAWLAHPLAASSYNGDFLRASIALARGDFSAAEQALLALMRRLPDRRLAYHKLFVAYVGRLRWRDAAGLEAKMNAVFAGDAPRLAEALRADFLRRAPRGQAAFFAHFDNFAAAIALVEGLPDPHIADRLMLAELYYRSGKPEMADGLVAALAGGPADFVACNAAAEMYLRRLYRPDKALPYLERSLRIKPEQPGIRELIRRLRSQQEVLTGMTAN